MLTNLLAQISSIKYLKNYLLSAHISNNSYNFLFHSYYIKSSLQKNFSGAIFVAVVIAATLSA